jgi:hypothetical protein
VSVRPFSGARQGVVDDGPDASDASVVEDGDDDDDDDDNFIVEDDNAGPGPELPIAFRNQQDLAYHFKIICQLLVHLATRRPEERHEFAIEAFKRECIGILDLVAQAHKGNCRGVFCRVSIPRTPQIGQPARLPRSLVHMAPRFQKIAGEISSARDCHARFCSPRVRCMPPGWSQVHQARARRREPVQSKRF